MSEHRDLDELDRHEQLLRQREERLQIAHQRRMEQEPSRTSGGVSGSHSMGKGFSDFTAGLAEHKGIILLVGGGIVVFIIVYYIINNQNSSTSAGANASPNLSAGGYLPSDISAQLASINQTLSSLGSGSGGSTTTGGGGGTTTGGGTNMSNYPQGSVFTNIGSGVLHYVTTGSQTLSQIAQQFGLQSWNSIYAIPENQQMLGRMSASTARGYTPAAGMNLVLPGGILPSSSWYQVGSATNQNSLAGIAQLENVNLSTINSLNPQLAGYTGTLLPGTEVQY